MEKNEKQVFKRIMKILLVFAWITMLVTVVVSYFVQNSISLNYLGDYLVTTSRIRMICLVIIIGTIVGEK
jgi:hypothetical protein